MGEIVQYIIVRKDLKMRKGKIASQVAHSSMKIFFDKMRWEGKKGMLDLSSSPDIYEWATKTFTKIVLYVESEIALLNIYKTALVRSLPVSLIEDAGRTEFGGVVTKTCVALGPHDKDDPYLKSLVENLKLL